MKTGVIFPSYASDMTYFGGGWSAEFPQQNLSDLVQPSKVARSLSVDHLTAAANFSTTRTVRAIAVIGHNLPATATAYFSFYSGPDFTGSYVGGTAAMPITGGQPIVPGYRKIFPYILPAPVACRSIYFVFAGATEALEIEAIEVGDFWEWPGISPGRSLGVSADADEIQLVGGAAYRPDKATPREIAGQIDLIAMAKTSTTGLDFQKGVDLQRPFVWAEDFDDATTWARKCLLARNVDLPGMTGALYRHDRFPIRMVEHMR